MSVGGQIDPRPYPAIVPVELVLAVVVPVAAILSLNVYARQLPVFLITAIPAGIALYAHGLLPRPRSVVLLGAVLYCAGILLATVLTSDVALLQFAYMVLPCVYLLYFVYIVSVIPTLDRTHVDMILLLIVVVGAIVAFANVILFVAGHPAATANGGSRLYAAFGVVSGRLPTMISMIYAVFAAAAFGLLVSVGQKRWIRILAALCFVTIGTALVLTQTRSGVVGALAGILAVLPFVRSRVRLYVLGSLAVVAVLALLAGIGEAVMQRGASYRTGIWVEFFRWGLETPVLGKGLLTDFGRMVDGQEFPHAHNLMLSAWLRGGIMSLAGMALILGGGIFWAWRYARRFENPVILAMIVTVAVAGLFDYQLLAKPTDWTWVAFWLSFGLAAGAEIAVRRDTRAAAQA